MQNLIQLLVLLQGEGQGFSHLQKIVFWPIDVINDVRCYINNRWFVKTHALTSHLKRGVWHELDTRLLHAAFDELVNFVEIDQAWMQVVFSEEDRKKYKTPWYRTVIRMGLWRCPEAGLAYLDWASNLKMDDDWFDKNDPSYGQPTSQALAAQEIFKLYKWWKEERPKRPDPMEASGWSAYCDEQDKKNKNEDKSILDTINKRDKRSAEILKICDSMEKEQDDEDTEMLIRLIKVRRHLWT